MIHFVAAPDGLVGIEEPLPLAPRLEQVFRHPDPARLNPLLNDLRGHDDREGIRQLGWKSADASPSQQEAIQAWCDTLSPPQREAFEKGRIQRRALMLTLRERPSFLDLDDLMHLNHTSRGIRSTLSRWHPSALHGLENLKQLASDIQRFNWGEDWHFQQLLALTKDAETTFERHTQLNNAQYVDVLEPRLDSTPSFDDLIVRIVALLPGAAPSRLLLRMIPAIGWQSESEQPARVDQIVELLPAVQPAFRVEVLTALIKVVVGSAPYKASVDPRTTSRHGSKAWTSLQNMQRQMLNQIPVRAWKEIQQALDHFASSGTGRSAVKTLGCEDTLMQRLSRELKNTRRLVHGRTRHLQVIVDSMSPLEGHGLLHIYDEAFGEIRYVTPGEVQTALLLKLVVQLKGVDANCSTMWVRDRFLMTWSALMSLNPGGLRPSDFVQMVLVLRRMEAGGRQNALFTLMQDATALRDFDLRQHALQTLREMFNLPVPLQRVTRR